MTVEFADASLRLLAPGNAGDDVFVEWQAEVGFLKQWRPTWPMLVGQVGFFDQFTVTMSRFALNTAVEPVETLLSNLSKCSTRDMVCRPLRRSPIDRNPPVADAASLTRTQAGLRTGPFADSA